MNKNIKRLTFSAVIGAIYAVVTILLAPISYGPIQFRIAEGLTILPLLFPESVVGLTIGCLIANIFGNGPLDIIFGTLATLVASLITMLIGRLIKNKYLKIGLGIIPPVLINAIVVPFTFLLATELASLYWISFAEVLLGQLISLICVGIPVYFAFEKIKTKINL